VPKAGDRTEIDGFPVTVERVVRRRVDRVFIERPPRTDEEDE
jgi:CBS domain containing-hemolysin-like protein